MNNPQPATDTLPIWIQQIRLYLPAVPDAFARLLLLIVVAFFLKTFLLQPYLIPSESMEHTLLVGDFVLVNKQVYAPSGRITRTFLPFRQVARGDVIIFHPPNDLNKLYVKRVVGIAGDRLHINFGRVTVNGTPVDEPFATFEPATRNPYRDEFPATAYTDPNIEPAWWARMQNLIRNGELVVPQGEYFVLGDNRNYSKDSRYWGFVGRQQIVARPLVIYFSLSRPSTTDVQPPVVQAADDKLEHGKELSAMLEGFARWKRIFHVVR